MTNRSGVQHESIDFADGSGVTDLGDLHRQTLLTPTIISDWDEVTVELLIPEWFGVELDRVTNRTPSRSRE